MCLDWYTLAGKMGVVEKIIEIQNGRRQRISEDHEAAVATVRAREQEKLDSEAPRRNFVKSQLEKIAKDSGVLDMLQQINKELLDMPGLSHGIVRTTGEHNDSVTFKLIWHDDGRYPNLYKKHMKNPQEIQGGSQIYVEINPDTESIKIQGE